MNTSEKYLFVESHSQGVQHPNRLGWYEHCKKKKKDGKPTPYAFSPHSDLSLSLSVCFHLVTSFTSFRLARSAVRGMN